MEENIKAAKFIKKIKNTGSLTFGDQGLVHIDLTSAFISRHSFFFKFL